MTLIRLDKYLDEWNFKYNIFIYTCYDKDCEDDVDSVFEEFSIYEKRIHNKKIYLIVLDDCDDLRSEDEDDVLNEDFMALTTSLKDIFNFIEDRVQKIVEYAKRIGATKVIVEINGKVVKEVKL